MTLRAAIEAHDMFLANVIRAHLKSPKILAFLYSASAPTASADLLHNMLEELGIEEEDGTSHPALLRRLAHGAGIGEALPGLERLADEDLDAIARTLDYYAVLPEDAETILELTTRENVFIKRYFGELTHDRLAMMAGR